ncbi:unnamed protein product, partial [marine sediment metagenome]
ESYFVIYDNSIDNPGKLGFKWLDSNIILEVVK